MSLDVQFMTLIAMIISGFYLGMILDTFRRLSIHWKGQTFLKYFMEISFWLTNTMLLYYVLFRVNSGELRFYVFAACLLGFSMYQVFASQVYKRLLEHIIRFLLAIYRFLEKIVNLLIVTPAKFIVQAFITVILFIIKLLLNVLRYIYLIVAFPISWLFRKTFRMLPQNLQLKLHKLAGFYSIMKNTCKKWIRYWMWKRR